MIGKINIPQGSLSNESLAAESIKVTRGFATLTGADYIINWKQNGRHGRSFHQLEQRKLLPRMKKNHLKVLASNCNMHLYMNIKSTHLPPHLA